MIGIAPLDPLHFIMTGLIVWAAVKSLRCARPLRSFLDRRTYRWTFADWFDATFWISVALAIVMAITRL